MAYAIMSLSPPSPFPSLKPNFFKIALPLSTDHRKPIPIHSLLLLHISNNLSSSDSSSTSSSRNQTRATSITTTAITTSTKTTILPQPFVSIFPDDVPRKGGADHILVEALEWEGVTDVFAYPGGGASMEIHQSSMEIQWSFRNVLPRHEQGGIFSITGQLPRKMIGTNAFQETPIVEVTRSITKHNYAVHESDLLSLAFGVRFDDIDPAEIGKNKQALTRSDTIRNVPASGLPGVCIATSGPPGATNLVTGLADACLDRIPGAYPSPDELSLKMLGMHGTVYANYAVHESDLFNGRTDFTRQTGLTHILETQQNFAGLGHLSTPYAVQNAGWASIFLLIGFGVSCTYTSAPRDIHGSLNLLIMNSTRNSSDSIEAATMNNDAIVVIDNELVNRVDVENNQPHRLHLARPQITGTCPSSSIHHHQLCFQSL